jgi:excisionase family DNA binding protein
MVNRKTLRDDEQKTSGVANQSGEPDCLLRAADLQELLGLSRAKIYRLMQDNVLPTVRIGKSIRVPQRALMRWIDKHTQSSSDAPVASQLPTDSVLTGQVGASWNRSASQHSGQTSTPRYGGTVCRGGQLVLKGAIYQKITPNPIVGPGAWGVKMENRAHSEALLTIGDVASWLGVSKGWVYDHVTRKQPRLPCIRLGEMTRFRKGDIEKFLEEHVKASGSRWPG